MQRGDSPRVLVLDDDPDDALLIEDHFDDMTASSYVVETETRVPQAIERLRDEAFDVLLCDYRLGAVSGLEMIEQLRAEGIDTPVILLTGVGTSELDQRALDAGAADFLAKDNLTPVLLDRTIRYALAAYERQRLLQAVLDAAGAAVMLVKHDGEVTLANAVATRWSNTLTGVEPDPAVRLKRFAQQAAEAGAGEMRLDAGVLDCTVQSFDDEHRLLVLYDVTDRARMLEERERSERDLARSARRDDLTGLGNRVDFNERIEALLARMNADGGCFALLSFDLDRFKEVNDVYGHAVGDDLLRAVAGRLRSACGDRVFLARLGGDEFVAIVPLRHDDGVRQAVMLAQDLLAVLGEPHDLGGKAVYCEASIGLAAYPQHGRDAETLLANADLAMYRAKATPTRALCVFEAEMDAAVRSDRALADELRRAIETDELDIFVQPQATLGTAAGARRLTGYEALARWTRRPDGPVPPDRFIMVAERSGLILPLGEHLLKRSVAAAAAWRERAKIAINVSPVQINHSDLPALLRTALVDNGLSPTDVEIEITETALLEHTTRALHALRQIRAMGVSIALDDFGTGYSSLAMLQSFPFDKIKIDRSFVLDIDRSGNDAIVRSIAQLGENLGITVLCEGVETEAHAKLLADLGCAEMQGYLLSKPFSADAVDAWQREFARSLAA